MRDAYYADNRDIVKWGVLLTLAGRHDIPRIVQVAYLRETTWGELVVDGETCPLPEAVLRHFRDVLAVSSMCAVPRIDVISDPFHDRDSYMRIVLRALSDRTDGETLLVFLDPDTGLEPSNPGFEHVLESEVRSIWQAMRPDDLLAFYQHQTNRNGQLWIEPKRRQLEAALDLPEGSVKVATGTSTARDVAFFYCVR